MPLNGHKYFFHNVNLKLGLCSCVFLGIALRVEVGKQFLKTVYQYAFKEDRIFIFQPHF